MAAMGQSGDLPNAGMAIVSISVLFWMVLDHLMITVAPYCEEIILPQEICLV